MFKEIDRIFADKEGVETKLQDMLNSRATAGSSFRVSRGATLGGGEEETMSLNVEGLVEGLVHSVNALIMTYYIYIYFLNYIFNMNNQK